MAETTTKKHLSATVYYLLFGMGLGWPALVATAWLLPEWAVGSTLSPLSLATIHILVLGSMLTVAFGVLYQIVPIAFQAPPIGRHVLFWHLPVHIVSVFLMVAGFLRSDFLVVGVGGSLLLVAACMYIFFVVQSYRRAHNRTPVHQSLILPLSGLLLVMLIGLFQAFDPKNVSAPVLMSHLLVGGLAFWGGLVVVISYKLVPMFVLSHGYKASLKRTGSLIFPGIVIWVIAVWLPPVAWTPAYMVVTILVSYGLISFVVDLVAIVRARKRKRIVAPLYDALFATGMIVASLMWLLVLLWTSNKADIIQPIYLFTFGGLLPLMFAYMQKIVPFLWFEYRFSKRPERKTAPLIDDMVPRKIAQPGFVLYYAGVFAELFSLIDQGNQATRSKSVASLHGLSGLVISHFIGAFLMMFGSLIIFLALQHVTTIGGRRPPDEPAEPARV